MIRCYLQAAYRRFAVLPGSVDPDKTAPGLCCGKRGRSRAIERVEHDIVPVRKKFYDPAGKFLGKHRRMIKLFHPVLGGDLPASNNPFLEFVSSDVNILTPASFFVGPLVKDLDELPSVFDIWHRGRFPAPPRCVLGVIVVLFPEKLSLPEQPEP